MTSRAARPWRVHVKVSGITTPEDALAAVDLGADSIGCVFVASSPRYVPLGQVRAIRAALPSSVPVIGIFANAPPALVRALAVHARLDAVELFGAEPRSVVEAMQPRAIKAASVRTREQLDVLARTYLTRRSRTDWPALLLHLVDEMATAWDTVAEVASRGPIFIASPQLDATTVGEAIVGIRPWGVDVWETVESSPGRLDKTRLRAFVEAVRSAQEAEL